MAACRKHTIILYQQEERADQGPIYEEITLKHEDNQNTTENSTQDILMEKNCCYSEARTSHPVSNN